MPIKTFVVDRQEVVRWGLTLACSDAAGLEVVGTAESLSNGASEILRTTPDVVIVDFQSNDASEVEHAQRILTAEPNLKLLVFSATDTRESVQAILNCGASGYLTKDASLAEVIIAVRAIHDGRIFISHSHPSPSPPKSSSPKSISNWNGLMAVSRYDAAQPETLSSREREVVLMLAEGLTNKEVASRLFLSVKTVETYRSRVMKKYQLRGRSELFSFAKHLSESLANSEALATSPVRQT